MTEIRDVQVLTDPVGAYNCAGCGAALDLAGRKAFAPFTCPSCSLQMLVPARLGGFLLLELLGTGGMGSAYRARDESLNRDVAIKVMRKSYGDDPAFVETFRHEAQAAAGLNHPHVVQIHSFGEARGQPYIVMELVRGGSLHSLIAAGEPLDQAMVMRIGAEIASGLQHGYQSHLVHGDIKPENILLDEKGAAKLVDFGIAQLAGRNATEVWGTPYYVAPEKVRRQRTDCRSDIYSLGGTLFHALAGKPPFDGTDATAVVKARFQSPAPPLRDLRPDIDPEIEAIVARMLQVEPAMRHPTYESLLSDIRRYTDRAKPASTGAKKVMMLRKKGSAANTTENVPATTTGSFGGTTGPAPAAPPAAKPGKLVIQAGSTGSSRYASSATGASAEAGTDDAAPLKKKGLPGWVVLLLVVVGLLGMCGMGVGVWYLLRKGQPGQPPPVAANQAAALQARQAAQQRLEAGAQQLAVAATNLAAWAEEGGRYVAQATNAVAGLLTADDREQLAPPRPAPVVQAPPERPAVADAHAAGTNAAGTNAVVVAAPAPIAPVEPEKEPAGLPPVVVMIRGMHRAWYRLEALAGEAAAEAAAIRAEAATAESATNAADALSALAEAVPARVKPYATGAGIDEARRKLANLRQNASDVAGQVATLAEQKRHRELELARQQAESNAVARANEIEAARQVKIRGEIANVQAKEREIAELLHKHEYNDARRALRTLLPDLTTEESRKALDIAIERTARLEELRDFLIAHLPGHQNGREGWKVDSADRRGLVVSNKGAVKDVAWADVGDVRMVYFIRYFLMTDGPSHDLKLREHVRQLINASMYCRYFVGSSRIVQDLADKMLEKAVAMLPDAKIDIERLLPGGGGRPESGGSGAETNKTDKAAGDGAAKQP